MATPASNCLAQKFGASGVVLPDPVQPELAHRRPGLPDVHLQRLQHPGRAGQQADQHAAGLQGVGPDDGLDAALDRVEEHHTHQHRRRDGEGQFEGHQRLQHAVVQHAPDQVQARGGPKQARDDEEQRTAALRLAAQARRQQLVDAGDAQRVIERQQHEGNQRVAHELAQRDLQVAELPGPDAARHADEGHARQRGADHAEGHQQPGAAPVADEEAVVVRRAAAPRRPARHPKQQQEIAGNDGQKQGSAHAGIVPALPYIAGRRQPGVARWSAP
jgi:hypothetical protein